MTDEDFDPVGIAEITQMTDPPMSKQHAAWLMADQDAPKPVHLARMKVWRRAEAAAWVKAHAERLAAGHVSGRVSAAYARPPRRREDSRPAEPPSAEVLELREWIASGRARAIREAAGLSLKAVAGEVGVGESTVWRWENGQKAPGAVHAAAYHGLLTRLAAGQGEP